MFLRFVILLLLVPSSLSAHPAIERRIAAIDAKLRANPNDVGAWLSRADAHRDHRDYDIAREDLEAARRVAPDDLDVTLALGRVELEAGNPGQAVKHLDACTLARPDFSRARVLRARALMALGRPLDAAADYGHVIDTRTTAGPDLFLRRAEALAAAGESHLPLAVATLDSGLARRGPVPTLALAAVEIELQLGRSEAALSRLTELAATAKRPGPWLIRKGKALESLGRTAEAIACYRSIEHGMTERERSSRRNSDVLEEAATRISALTEGAGR